MPDKIAIVGGGVAGLTAGHLLRERCDVTLFEKDDRVGGNAYTLDLDDGQEVDVSVFFYSTVSYPTFFELLARLGPRFKPVRHTVASMTYLDLDTGATMSLDPRQMTRLRPSAIKSAYNGVLAFRNTRAALQLLKEGALEGKSVEEALAMLPHQQSHARKMLIFPLCLASSMSYAEVLAAPAPFFIGKMRTHFGSARRVAAWCPLNVRTREYIEALAATLEGRIRLGADIGSVVRDEQGVEIALRNGQRERFDQVIFACNADQALRLLDAPTDDEKRLLGAWRYKEGRVLVHTDTHAFPPEKQWSMYDYLYTERDGEIETSINAAYRFQPGVSADCRALGTQHPNFPVREETVQLDRVFRTPIFDDASVRTIAELSQLNGVRQTWYCGSHFGHGLHEDAVRSAVDVAVKLGAIW